MLVQPYIITYGNEALFSWNPKKIVNLHITIFKVIYIRTQDVTHFERQYPIQSLKSVYQGDINMIIWHRNEGKSDISSKSHTHLYQCTNILFGTTTKCICVCKNMRLMESLTWCSCTL